MDLLASPTPSQPRWTRTPPISQRQNAKRLPSLANKENETCASALSPPSGQAPAAASNSAPPGFYPVDVRLASGEVLLGGALAVSGKGQATWTGRKQRTILGEGRDNSGEVSFKFDYSGARMMQVEDAKVLVGGDALFFKSCNEANAAAAVLAQEPNFPAGSTESAMTPKAQARRRSIDLGSVELSPLGSTLQVRASPKRGAPQRSPPAANTELRERVREFVRLNSEASSAAIRALAPDYALEPVRSVSSSPPSYAPPSRAQLLELKPIVQAMVARSEEDKQRILRCTGVLATSPDARQGRSRNTFVDAATGRALAPQEYEQRYRAVELHPPPVQPQPLGASQAPPAPKALLQARLEDVTAELHASFERALQVFFQKRDEINAQLAQLSP